MGIEVPTAGPTCAAAGVVLVAEPDAQLASLLRRGLEGQDYFVDLAATAGAIERLLAVKDYEALIVEQSLPDRSGVELVRQLRREGKPAGVLLMSAQARDVEIAAGLDAGADDWVRKPFSEVELYARLRAVLRRRREAGAEVLTFGGVELERRGRKVTVQGRTVRLTGREYQLLEILMRQPQALVPRRELTERVLGYAFDPGSNVLHVHMAHLRAKLKAAGALARIETHRGQGFRLSAE